MEKNCMVLFCDGKYEFQEYENNCLPILQNRNASYGKINEYKSDNSIIELMKEQFPKIETKIELCPMSYYNKYGFNLNMIFITGEDFSEESHKKLFPSQNIYGTYLIKYRCPYGYCLIYDEKKNMSKEYFEEIKKLGEIKITDTQKILCPKFGSKKNQIKKYIDILYNSGCVHHEVLTLLIEPALKLNYIDKMRPAYYDFFSSYSVKYGEAAPITIFVGDESKMAESYNKKTLNFPKK
jgi:hypothetical protein